MWQFAQAVEGIGAACRALDMPITGGNVSLYNETDGRAILPTPVLGVVGLIEDADRVVRRGAFRTTGDAVVLLGESRGELGGSEYLEGRARPACAACRRRSISTRERALQTLLVDAAADGLRCGRRTTVRKAAWR